ncbi:hypothetical protein D046_5892B, partial [Vibrio parahaemolyticus V-223/04]
LAPLFTFSDFGIFIKEMKSRNED